MPRKSKNKEAVSAVDVKKHIDKTIKWISEQDTFEHPVVYIDINSPKEYIDMLEKCGYKVVLEDRVALEAERKKKQEFYEKLLNIANFNLDGSYNTKNPNFKTTKKRIEFFTSFANCKSIMDFLEEHWDSEFIGENQKVKVRAALEDAVSKIAQTRPEPIRDVYFSR